MISRFSKFLLAAVSLLVLGTEFSRADLVDVSLTLNVVETSPGAGTFELLAAANSTLNAGLASYNIPLTGGILALDHKSPNGLGLNSATLSGGPIGFTLLRSGDNITLLNASQDTVDPNGMLIYDMGILGGNISISATPTPSVVFISEQPLYGAPLLIADGTWSSSQPGFSSPIAGNVFNLARDGTTFAGAFETTVNFSAIPEPSAALMILLSFAAVAAIKVTPRFRCFVGGGKY